MRRRIRAPGWLAALAALAVLAACQAAPAAAGLRPDAAAPAGGAPGPASAWVGTWATAVQLTEPHNLPPPPGLAAHTLRQVVRVSIGGDSLRVRFSNLFGDGPVTLNSAALAASAGGGRIETATLRPLTFGGRRMVRIPAGETALSDPVAFRLPPLSTVAVTVHFGDVPADVTGHPGSRTTSWIQPGDAVAAEDLGEAVRVERWYFLTGIDVLARDEAAAVVTLGNSITDGRGSGTDRHNRWPDELARRLQADPATARVAVLNQGIGGNCVLRACLGPATMDRFERDVLDQPGARWLIVLHGVNDLGQAQGPAGAEAVARDLVAAYEQMIDQATTRGIRVYGATILPFGGSFYDSPEREAARQRVNQWIRTDGRFHGVIDTDAALRDPSQPSRLRPDADTGDHLHPNEVGHRLIAEAVDAALLN
jgi:lysophospholipase L1-like esterase